MRHQENGPLLEALAKCAAECSHCASACLNDENPARLAKCIRLTIDCAEICQISISFVSHGSHLAPEVLNECAGISIACAAECEKHADHMDHCKRCAEVCRECAEQCQTGVAA